MLTSELPQSSFLLPSKDDFVVTDFVVSDSGANRQQGIVENNK
jgi:hypothetical protein